MPRCFTVRLEHLCIQSIVHHWETLTADVNSNFDDQEDGTCTLLQCLPEHLIHDIQRRLAFSRGSSPSLALKDLKILIQCRPMIRIDLRDFALPKPKIVQVLQYLTNRSLTLRELSLSNAIIKRCYNLPKCLQETTNNMTPNLSFSFLNSDFLNTFLRSLPNLRYLSFRSTNCQDWMLKTVAKNCPRLQELDVSHCSDVSDLGIVAFCDQQTIACTVLLLKFANDNEQLRSDEHQHEHQMICCQQKLVKIWLVGTKVTENALVELLLNFPQLQFCHHPDLLNSAFFITGPSWSHPASRKKSTVNPLLTNLVSHVTWSVYLQEPSQLTSSITSLELTGLTSDISLSFLSHLDNLVSLTLRCCTYVSKCGTNLDLLANLVNRRYKLRHLTLNVNGPLMLTRSTFPPKAFQTLETLDIDRAGSASLSSTDAMRLLGGCLRLKRLRLKSCPWLTDKILDDLLRENKLTNALEVAFYDSKLSFDGIKRLLHLPNSLTLLSVGTELVGKKHYLLFNNYIRKKNWQLVLRLYTASSPNFD